MTLIQFSLCANKCGLNTWHLLIESFIKLHERDTGIIEKKLRAAEVELLQKSVANLQSGSKA